MGFSALDGLMMGTRCGSIDPGVLLYLLEQGWSHERIQSLLYKQSGLLGVSGIAADMRTLRANHALRPGSPLTCSPTASYAAALANSPPACPAWMCWPSVAASAKTTRCCAQVCQKLAYLGVRVDEVATNPPGARAPAPSTQPTAQWKYGWSPRTKAMWPRRRLRR